MTTSVVDRLSTVRTNVDGSYALITCPNDTSLGTISASNWQLVDGVAIGAPGTTTTVNFSC